MAMKVQWRWWICHGLPQHDRGESGFFWQCIMAAFHVAEWCRGMAIVEITQDST